MVEGQTEDVLFEGFEVGEDGVGFGVFGLFVHHF